MNDVAEKTRPPGTPKDGSPRRKQRPYKRVRRLRFKIDQLPPEADPAVRRVRERLREGRDTQQLILFDLHTDLRQLGIKTTISKSSMSNYAKWVAAQGHEIETMRDTAALFVERLGTTQGSDVELYLQELVRTAIGKAITAIVARDGEEMDMVALRDAATALFRLSKAREISLDTRRMALKDVSDNLDRHAKERGISTKQVTEFKRMLGIPVGDDATDAPDDEDEPS